jgi:hypothetical protein
MGSRRKGASFVRIDENGNSFRMHGRKSNKPYTALGQFDTAGDEGQEETKGGDGSGERLMPSIFSSRSGNTMIVVLSDPESVTLFRNSVANLVEAI